MHFQYDVVRRLIILTQLSSIAEILSKRGFLVSQFDTAAQATDYLNRQIDGVTVGIGGSMTIDAMGLYSLLSEHNTVYWHWKGDDLAKAAHAHTYLCSVNAVDRIRWIYLGGVSTARQLLLALPR